MVTRLLQQSVQVKLSYRQDADLGGHALDHGAGDAHGAEDQPAQGRPQTLLGRDCFNQRQKHYRDQVRNL